MSCQLIVLFLPPPPPPPNIHTLLFLHTLIFYTHAGTPGGRDTHREPADTLVYQNISMLSRSLDMLHRPSPTPTPHTAPQQLYEDVDGFRQNPSYPVGQTIRAPEENYDYVVNVGAKMSVIPRSSVGDY